MSMIGSHRLVNAIENGSYATHGDLTTALATTRTRVEFQGAVRNTTLLTRLMSNQVAVPLIIDSTTASTDLFNSDSATLCAVLPKSYEFMKAIVTTTARFDKLKAVPGMIYALHRSDIALKILNTDAIDAIFSTFPFHYTSIDIGTTAVVGVVYSSLYRTTVAITTDSISCRAAGQKYFNTITGTGADTINDIAANTDGSIIVVATNSGILYSTDGGYNWSGSGTPGSTKSVIFGSSASLFVCQSNSDGDLYSSSDGSSWTLRYSSPGSGTVNPRVRGYAAGLYVFQTIDTNYISMVTSTNGTAWTAYILSAISANPSQTQKGTSIAVYDANNAYAAGAGTLPTGTNKAWSAYTTDGGANWTVTSTGSTTTTGHKLSVAATDAGWLHGYYADQTHASNKAGYIANTAGSGGTFEITDNQTIDDTSWPAYGRGIGLFCTKSAGPLIVGATSGSVVQVTKLNNPAGSAIVCSSIVPPFITGNGIYIPGASGDLYCSNVAL